MANNKITVALLGAGYIVDYHFSALRLLPNVEIKAVCDLNRRRAEHFADLKGIPRVYADLGDMLAHEPLDVVQVLTPPHVHFQASSQIIAAGLDVMSEKPLCHTVADCQQLRDQARAKGKLIGVTHNFLYLPVYEKLVADWRSGRLGQIDQVDIIWNKELGQLRGGPFGSWMLQTPTNILFEVAPHSFAHLVHLLGGLPDSIAVEVRDKVELPRGLEFYRRWEIRGWKGNTSIRIRFAFIDGYPEQYIHVRGTNAVAHVDIEHNTYTCQEHTPKPFDVDHYANVVGPAKNAFLQANGTLAKFVLYKMKLLKSAGGPYAQSIARTVASFYEGRHSGTLDERISPELGQAAVNLAEWVAREANLPAPQKPAESFMPAAPAQKPTVLVIGGTGFIGKVLVRHLCESGYSVRVLARDPQSCPPELAQLKLEITKGDFTDPDSVAAALNGIEQVYHLGRGVGNTWPEYLKTDVEPTRKVAELCLKHGVKRLYYTSSIAIYNAGDPSLVITEATPADPNVISISPYARSKVENEQILLDLHRDRKLPVIIFRPAIVLGRGGSPYHWGVVAWPYNSVCLVWGKGNNPLPIVLVNDVAAAMVKAIAVPNIEGAAYNLTSLPCLTANDYLDEFEQHAGIQLTRIPASNWRYYLESLAKWSIKKVGRDPGAAFPSYAEIKGRSFASTFNSSKAQRELGWTPISDRDTLIKEGIWAPVDEFLK
ncbi:putative dehydrogenase [Thioploca ingrica]|uniref:Putative dehydrogenase n=1 Tax=Thioploca ingrica TaxID=40754 RepID=A0A090AII2_9GAMM|nr:putative dehydrogenase [Thioploca ingrica]